MERHSYRADESVPDFDDTHPLVVFDGVCVLCSAWIGFVMRRDPAGRIRFAAAQGPLGEALFDHYGLRSGGDYDTVLVIADGRLHTESDSALVILSLLGWPWKLAGLARVVPRALRDRLYRLVARNRYQWFGRREHCRVPTPNERERFL